MKHSYGKLFFSLTSAAVALGLAACAQTPTPKVADTLTTKTPLASQIIDTNSLVAKATASGSRRDVFNGPTKTLDNFESHITTVNPGEAAHLPHTHGNEEMLIIKEGTLEVTIKGEPPQIAGPGAIIFYAPNDLHGTRNIGVVPVTYYVFSWVTPKTPATIPPTTAPAAK